MDGWTILQILLLLIVPAGLFIFWYQYLRRLHDNEDAKNGPWGWGNNRGGMSASAAPVDGKRTCGRCGLTVNPPKGSGPPTCPNCMNVL